MNQQTRDRVAENVLAINEWCKEWFKERIEPMETSLFLSYRLMYNGEPRLIVIDKDGIRISYGYNGYYVYAQSSKQDLCKHALGIELVLHWQEVKSSIINDTMIMEEKYKAIHEFKL